MYAMQDEAGAITLMIVSLWCLGSWPALFNLLERRGRVPMHTYLDYTFSNYSVALLFALTVGNIGPDTPQSPNFLKQLSQENGPSVAFGLAGGLALCLGNICLQYSLAFVGISLTEVVSASVAVVLGTTANYFLDDGLNRASILFPGVACFLVAVVLGSFCHASNVADMQTKIKAAEPLSQMLEDMKSPMKGSEEFTALLVNSSNNHEAYTEYHGDVKRVASSLNVLSSSHNSDCKSRKPEPLSKGVVANAEYLLNLESHRAIKVNGKSVVFGLGIALITGLCYAAFSPLFNVATNDQFHLLKPDREGRHIAIVAGLLCGVGNGFQFMGGQAAGYAAADAVQALPLVGTLWGVFLFKEYHGSSRKTYILLIGMLLMFLTAVVMLVASSMPRHGSETLT
uniref:Ureide permease n=1 Tax=Physcomitrium patens TaxID=3218 RepID=A0A7I4AUA4_PHYPA|nr:ureide permease 1-like isoform X3 [Physcomitrium patens]|eukprot:XP_024397594.1 ureide permease 1-like isoform X3 [Physcomitrella patens]